MHNTSVVLPRILIITRNDNLAKRVAGLSQRQDLLFSLFIRRHRIRRLDVDTLSGKVHDKIYLVLTFFALSALARNIVAISSERNEELDTVTKMSVCGRALSSFRDPYNADSARFRSSRFGVCP